MVHIFRKLFFFKEKPVVTVVVIFADQKGTLPLPSYSFSINATFQCISFYMMR